MSSRKSRASKSTAATSKALEPIASDSAASAAPAPAPAPVSAPAPALAPDSAAREATLWPLLCPTPDCNEHLRAHPHPSAPVLFAACGHSHCGLCAAVVLREPLPQCPTCGVGVGAGQASPNTGLGLYGEVVLSACAPGTTGSMDAHAQFCTACKYNEGVDEPATYACSSRDCEDKLLCCDHSRFHAKKTGHMPVCLEGAPAEAGGRGECTVHALPLSHYCMLHFELLCSNCAVTKHLSCGITHVKTAQEAADHVFPVLSAAVTTFTESANGMLHAIPAIATAKADMASRLQSSLSRFSESIDAVIAALHAHRSRVTTAANLQCAEYTKALDSQAEVMSVSASQLQAASAMTVGAMSSCSPVRILEAHATVKAMAALVKQYDGPVVVPVVEVRCEAEKLVDSLGELSKVVTGCRLQVVSVSGLVLQPGSQQELRVVLSLEDGSVPSWLMYSDVECTVQGVRVDGHPCKLSVCSGDAAGATASDFNVLAVEVAVARVLSRHVSPAGKVSIAFELQSSHGAVDEVALQLSVCGVKLGPATGWRAIRQHSSLSCLAVGTHVRTLPVVRGYKYGLVVSADEKWMVVGQNTECTLSVYSLPDGELVRTFGGSGSGPLQFWDLYRLSFAPNGNLLVVDSRNFRLQEVTLEGVFVRFVGEGAWSSAVGRPRSVAVRNAVIAVGSGGGAGPRVTLLGFSSGVVTSQFGKVGTAPGQLSRYCDGICFTADGSHLVVAESGADALSVFTVGGVFVQCIGVGVVSQFGKDACLSAKGEYVVADRYYHRVCVFSTDGSELLRSWGTKGTGDGQFERPTALAIAGAHLYVLDCDSPRVQVFE